MAISALALALVVRAITVLPLPQTLFQPDEFYQSLEPAHRLIFSYGYLTWEWKDLPFATSSTWYDLIQGGRMRGWIWPGVMAWVYKCLQVLHLDHTRLITLSPRIVGIIVAALTDFYTFKLAGKLLGPENAAPALFLSLTSLFNAHALPRTLSTSPETLLTTMAIYYFPLGGQNTTSHGRRSEVGGSRAAEVRLKAKVNGQGKIQYISTNRHAITNSSALLSLTPAFSVHLVSSICLASFALCLRPTTVIFWAVLGVQLVWRRFKTQGTSSAFRTVITAMASVITVVSASCLLDFAITGRFYISALTFAHHNVFRNLSAFYGATDKMYHLTQSLPILLFPIWWWWGQGYLSCLLSTSMLPDRLLSLARPVKMRTLARAIGISLFALSLSPHSEWRFLHPWLPSLLIFAIPPLTRSFTPSMARSYRFGYTRIPERSFYFLLLVPVVPYLYLNAFHGAAQVEVMKVLRNEGANLNKLIALMPCHSTPWMSHLHRDIDGWFLTCEPPLGPEPDAHRTQQTIFYAKPVTYLHNVFPYPPVLLHDIPDTIAKPDFPSHIILFGELLDRKEPGTTFADTLVGMGYSEIWHGWNGFDVLQDEPLRRGGVRIWYHGGGRGIRHK